MARRYFVAAACGLLAISCGGGSPTSSSPAGASLSGRVTSALTSSPIAGATVAINDGPNAGMSATTDASGNYSFTGLDQSGFTVNVSAEGFVTQSRGITTASTQTQSFQLAGIRTLIRNRPQTILARRGNGSPFTTSRPGRVEIETSWTNASNLVRLEVALDSNCGAPQYTSGTCTFLYADRNPVTIARRNATINALPPGNYIIWLTNQGSSDESVTLDVYLTP